jgi:hypothetical protein
MLRGMSSSLLGAVLYQLRPSCSIDLGQTPQNTHLRMREFVLIFLLHGLAGVWLMGGMAGSIDLQQYNRAVLTYISTTIPY